MPQTDQTNTASTPIQKIAEAASGSSEGMSAVDATMQSEPISLERIPELLENKMGHWFDASVALLPNIAVAFILLVLFFVTSSLVGRAASRAFSRAFDSNAVANLAAACLKVLIVTVGIFVALDLIGLQKAVISLLAGAGIIGLAIGFAFQDLAENLLAGILLGIRKPCEPGDLISTNNQFGTVQRLNLRNTIIKNFSGQIIYVPNKEVFTSVLENFTKSGERRIDIGVGVSYNEDLDRVETTLRDAINSLDFRKKDTDVYVYALEFGDSSINFSVRYWMDYPHESVDYFAAIDAGIKAIKKAFDEADILIPFPIRTLDFNAKGGLKLEDSLEPLTDKQPNSDPSG